VATIGPCMTKRAGSGAHTDRPALRGALAFATPPAAAPSDGSDPGAGLVWGARGGNYGAARVERGKTARMETNPARPGGAEVRQANERDLDIIVEQTWQVASEGRWIGAEVPFDRDARRERLASALANDSATVLVACTPGGGDGPSMVGHIWVSIAPYGVADIGMLVVESARVPLPAGGSGSARANDDQPLIRGGSPLHPERPSHSVQASAATSTPKRAASLASRPFRNPQSRPA
jgi:hypothetical protein